jgi:hypothetical protein
VKWNAFKAWLNQVELWFAKIERDVIARSVFTWGRRSAAQVNESQ